MTELVTGIKIINDGVDFQSVSGAPMSKVGIIGTAPAADLTKFPLNTPVRVRTNDGELRAFLGASGTLEDALALISAQLDGSTTAADVVVVNVEEGQDIYGTIANAVGNESSRTGAWALLAAGDELGVEPRLLIAPGLTSQTKAGVKTIVLSAGGTGYTSAPSVTIGAPSLGGVQATATAALSNGITIAITTAGTGYSTAPTITIAPPPPGGVQAIATATVSGGLITAITITNHGYGYLTAPAIVVSGGGGTGGVLTATLTGRVRTVTVTEAGTDYASAPSISFSGGSGTGATATSTVGQNANAICAIMPTIGGRLGGFFIPDGPTNSEEAYNTWLETLPASKHILHPCSQLAQITDSVGVTRSVPGSPVMVGQYVRVDAENDGLPVKSISNQVVNGIVGATPAIPFNLRDASAKGQAYLGNSAGIFAKGQAGVVGAATLSGFTTWAYDTMAADSNYKMAKVARTRAWLELTVTSATTYFLGRTNITVQGVQAVKTTMDNILARAKAEGAIIDYRITFDEALNTPSEIRLGQIDIIMSAEETPVLKKLVIRSRKYPEAITTLTQQISVALGNSAA